MAAALRTLRLAQRAQCLRQSPVTSTRALAPRSYATDVQRPATDVKSPPMAEQASEDLRDDGTDPNMNGNYPDPTLTSALPVKRQFRDPYAKWWDPQERRNYGEPVHEDNDILGIFSPEKYTHVTPGWGAVQFGCFVAAFCTMLGVVYRFYPDKSSTPREFPDGLEAELGGPSAMIARKNAEKELAV